MLPLLAAWIVLIVYASLYPFAGWRWPPGASALELLRLPWPRYWIGFDIAANLLGYLPLGFLVHVAGWRRNAPAGAAIGAAAIVAALLSGTMEVTQHLLPERVPSLADALFNIVGAVAGALVAAACRALGWLGRWRQARNRWFSRGSAGATALLLLWPVALLFPAPVPLGLGQVGAPLRHALASLLPDAAALDALVTWLDRPEPPAARLPAAVEGLTSALGLLAPVLLATAAARPRRARAAITLGALLIGLGVTTLSTLLNFGPEHAWAWATSAAGVGLAAAAALAWVAGQLAPARAAALGVAVLLAQVALVHLAPADPYFAQSLQGWEQGRFVRFHGVAQWAGWLWPYAALAWLLARLGRTVSPRNRGLP